MSEPKSLHEFKPLSDQEVVEVIDYESTSPPHHLSAIEALKDLAGVKHLGEVGLRGSVKAATSTEQNKALNGQQLYEVFFVRDAHIVASFLRERFPNLTKATIAETVKFTGTRENLRPIDLYDEQEEHKAPHEVRDPLSDLIAQKLIDEKKWGWPYYGALDTTAKNACAISFVAQYEGLDFLTTTYKGMDGQTHNYQEALHGHLNWVRKRMNLNPEGLVEALKINPYHHANQTWQDSPDGFHHKDGSWARHYPEKNLGVAPLELQVEIYDTLICARDVYISQLVQVDTQEQGYLVNEIQDLSLRAEKLRRIVLDKFWIEEDSDAGGYFARGTDRDEDGNLRPLEIKSADMGHLLNSCILEGDDPETVKKRTAVIKQLFSPELLCTKGLRTLSSDSIRYYEDAYHNGNSWVWQTYYIARGLERHGYYGLSHELKKRAFSVYEKTKVFPEYSTGSNDPDKHTVSRKIVISDPSLDYKEKYQITQPPQEIQAWTVAAILAMKYENGKRIFGKQAVPIKATDPQKLLLEEELLPYAA